MKVASLSVQHFRKYPEQSDGKTQSWLRAPAASYCATDLMTIEKLKPYTLLDGPVPVRTRVTAIIIDTTAACDVDGSMCPAWYGMGYLVRFEVKTSSANSTMISVKLASSRDRWPILKFLFRRFHLYRIYLPDCPPLDFRILH
ncbi:hypothetical protein EVAR_28473_1 [Eumeta japonica]|uniref:Uncharacterized protein n=1 Tax=Eumeta variegata TaxID=151549 RepID=A0A4C1V808_EUMVA|nr:hypothetical protein EVAR_28473_1 [Eumeta japonica]